jgi:hypothetical protein
VVIDVGGATDECSRRVDLEKFVERPLARSLHHPCARVHSASLPLVAPSSQYTEADGIYLA